LTGVLGVAAIDLKTGRMLQYNGDAVFPQASSIKIPIMIEVFRAVRAGKLSLDTSVTLDGKDAVGGSGHLRILLRSRPVTLTVRELIGAMIETSDNTATNRLIAMVGMPAVNELLTQMGLKSTRLQRKMLEPNAAAENRENISTPMEMARLAESLYRGKAVDAEASREMIEILKRVSASFRMSIPENVPVAAKPGELNGVRAETGIIFLTNRPFVLSVMSSYLDQGVNPISAVTRMFYDYFEKLANSNRYGHKLQ
jgi:beta-lactamase class A